MFSPIRIVTLLSLAVFASSSILPRVSPATTLSKGGQAAADVDLSGTTTDSSTIVATANNVDQKTSVAPDTPPDLAVQATQVTAIDGQITDAGTNSSTRRSFPSFNARSNAPFVKRDIDGRPYEQVFAGTGTGPDDRDASIEGTAYLTYTLIDNSTYNVDACLDFCSSVQGCVFANLYYEFNNFGLDFATFGIASNLKCAVYGDTHTAAEKLNFGQQQSYPAPAPLIYIQQSSGYSSKELVDPDTPAGYDLVFGPTNGANNAPGYMGFAFLDKYDVNACAQLCNERGSDSAGGACQYFNIWRAVVSGIPTTYTCSMYFLVADESTAVNTGQGDLVVTFSRGYSRKNLLPDGGFEGFDSDFFAESYSAWTGTSPPGGSLDAIIFDFPSFARTGHSCGELGSGSGADSLSGTLTANTALATIPGNQYKIAFWQGSFFNGDLESGAFLQVLWNGNVVLTLNPGFQQYTYYEVVVTAAGSDTLAFFGGVFPAYSFIDDVAVYAQST